MENNDYLKNLKEFVSSSIEKKDKENEPKILNENKSKKISK